MIPVHVAVEKNIRNAVEEKSKWRIFQLGKFFCSSFNRRDKRQLYGIRETKNKSCVFREDNATSYFKADAWNNNVLTNKCSYGMIKTDKRWR